MPQIDDVIQALGTKDGDIINDLKTRIAKSGQTLPPVNAQPMTGQAAMSALGIPDISKMTPEEQQMFMLAAVPMVAAGPEAKVAEEAIPSAVQAATKGIRAYHGSPYDFAKFDMSKIGTGEGAQAYGHGLYFAENPAVAQEYRRNLAPMEAPIQEGNFWKVRFRDATGEWAERDFKTQDEANQFAKSGKTYEVAINADPEHFLDWDKPLSEQSQKVKEALNQSWGLPSEETQKNMTGQDVYRTLAQTNPEALRQAGIPGIKYLDQGSRSGSYWMQVEKDGTFSVQGPGNISYGTFPTREEALAFSKNKNAESSTSNFVVFDENLIDIVKKYGLAALIGAGANHFKKSTGASE